MSDTLIERNLGILGGTPVIAGTRVSVYSILGWLQDGDSVDEILREYPEIPREAIVAAELYAKAHPLRGRASGRPWSN